MKQIQISKNLVTLVDDDDYDFLVGYRWTALCEPHTTYAINKMGLMHRLVIRCPRWLEVDHIDGNGLNNQKANLRICTRSDNLANTGIRAANSSGYKGVSWHKRTKKWRARIQFRRKSQDIGYYDSAEEAALAYNQRAEELFTEFARLNTVL